MTATIAFHTDSLACSTSNLDIDSGSFDGEDADLYNEGPLNTPLHAAAVNGNKSLLQRLLQEAFAEGDASIIDTEDRFGRTPLVYSILGDRVECAEVLLKNGASVSHPDVDRRTPLHWAAYQGNHKCVKLLLSKGANWKSKDKEGRTPLHFAASYNSCKCLNLLLKTAGKGEVDDPDNNSMTALHWGASFGNGDHVKLLLKYKASITAQDSEKKTPLHWAATNQNASVVKLILEQSTEMINWPDTEGRTALHLAVSQQNEAVIRALVSVDTCDVSVQDNTYRAPLHWAAVLGNSKIVKILLRKNADYHSVDGNGATPLHYCAQNNLAQTVETFLSYSRMKDIPDKEGQTAVMWAAGKGSSAALETMLHHNLDVHAADKFERTALHAAAYSGHLTCVQLLLQHGAGVNALDMHNHTPIFRACETGHASVVILLLENGAAVTLEDQDGRSPLHWAALGGHTQICQTLIKNGVFADAKDRLGCTPLQCAAYGGFVSCMSLLIEHGAKVNTCDKDGISALHWSCSSGHLEAVKLLLRHGAFLNFMEVDGERLTPLDYAIFGDHQDVAQYLIEQGGLTITAIQDVAATAIQSCWRGYRVRKPFQNRKDLYMKHEQLKRDIQMRKQEKYRRRLLNKDHHELEEECAESTDMPPNTEAAIMMVFSEDCDDIAQRKYSYESTSENSGNLSTIFEHSFILSRNSSFDGNAGKDMLERGAGPEMSQSATLDDSRNTLQVLTPFETKEHTDLQLMNQALSSACAGYQSARKDVMYEFPDQTKAQTWAERARRERERLNMIRTKVNAATIIQRWFRRVSPIKHRPNTDYLDQSRKEIAELILDQEALKHQVAALVIQLAWRRFVRRKAYKAQEHGEQSIETSETTLSSPEQPPIGEVQSAVRREQPKSEKTPPSTTPSPPPKQPSKPTESRRAKSGVFGRRSISSARHNSTIDSRRHRRSAPSPAAISFNNALEMYNPMSTRRMNDRVSTPRRSNKVKPTATRRTGWGP
ncbi:inversin [Nematostella vectensis]|uniref:inversin n=1 Tax=Nematostella vectensis TaxID=45351 RepID=UPI002076E794|nr:inversin [Nematostella vectensis]